jgi:hypothetical protein
MMIDPIIRYVVITHHPSLVFQVFDVIIVLFIVFDAFFFLYVSGLRGE